MAITVAKHSTAQRAHNGNDNIIVASKRRRDVVLTSSWRYFCVVCPPGDYKLDIIVQIRFCWSNNIFHNVWQDLMNYKCFTARTLMWFPMLNPRFSNNRFSYILLIICYACKYMTNVYLEYCGTHVIGCDNNTHMQCGWLFYHGRVFFKYWIQLALSLQKAFTSSCVKDAPGRTIIQAQPSSPRRGSGTPKICNKSLFHNPSGHMTYMY